MHGGGLVDPVFVAILLVPYFITAVNGISGGRSISHGACFSILFQSHFKHIWLFQSFPFYHNFSMCGVYATLCVFSCLCFPCVCLSVMWTMYISIYPLGMGDVNTTVKCELLTENFYSKQIFFAESIVGYRCIGPLIAS